MEEKNNKKKILKRIIILILSLIIIIIGATIGIGNYFVNYAISRTGNGGDREIKNEDTVEVANINDETEKIIEENRKEENQLANQWSNEVRNENVQVTAKDGITLIPYLFASAMIAFTSALVRYSSDMIEGSVSH